MSSAYSKRSAPLVSRCPKGTALPSLRQRPRQSARHMHEVKLGLEQEQTCAEIDRIIGRIAKDAIAGLVESEQITDLDRITFAEFRDSCLELGLPHLPAPPQA